MNEVENIEPAEVLMEHNYSSIQFKPLFVQRIERNLSLDSVIQASETVIAGVEDSEDDLKTEDQQFLNRYRPSKVQAKRERGRPSASNVHCEATEKKYMRQSLYCTGHLKYKKKWLRDLLLSDSDSSDEELNPDKPVSDSQFKELLEEYSQLSKYRAAFSTLSNKNEFKEYTLGILGQDQFPELSHERRPQLKRKSAGPAKNTSNVKQNNANRKDGHKEDRELQLDIDVDSSQNCQDADSAPGASQPNAGNSKAAKSKKPVTAEVLLARRKKFWHSIVKKDIPKAAKARANAKKEQLGNARKCAMAIMKLKRREALASQKAMASLQSRMRRICRDVAVYWKRFEKVEKQQMKKVQKEAQEQRKQDLNLLEAKRQARKLNFLITQTELYAHFMAKKITGASEEEREHILNRLDEKEDLQLHSSVLDDYDADEVKEQIISNVQDAYDAQTSRTHQFDFSVTANISGNMGLSTPQASEHEYPQPSIFVGKLKSYQVKGMNWLANLYSQGINGILADEMGLGKTVQSIAFLAHLAEVHGIWGPFLVVAPASTLHNWQQECARFLPKMRVVPYWGTAQERKILRKFWDQQHLHTEQASFHIVITSYQLVILDAKYFAKINWHYMVLDEAQALKSSASARWKTLLSFSCRNRLLLTGTPIQNSMAELWALLHFIMPTLFDSHEEFNEWFSKDIENHVENKGSIDQNHLSRLHMILKPFMLRRIKRDVENDLTDKIEVLVYCPLTIRQRYLYDAIKKKIRIEDLLAGVTQASAASSSSATSSLMNLVMQFRKVCNHPELFERRDVKSPAHVDVEPYLLPKLVYRESVGDCLSPSHHLLRRLLSIHQPDYTHYRNSTQNIHFDDNPFSWMPLINMTCGDLYKVMLMGFLPILLRVYAAMREKQLLRHHKTWSGSTSRFVQRRMLIIRDEMPTDETNRQADSDLMSQLVFTRYNSHSYSHLTHSLYYMKETSAHQKIRLRGQQSESQEPALPSSPAKKRLTKSVNKTARHLPSDTDEKNRSAMALGDFRHDECRLARSLPLQLTDMPQFLSHIIPKAESRPAELYCYDQSAEYERLSQHSCDPTPVQQLLMTGYEPYSTSCWRTVHPSGLQAIEPPYGFSNIYIPDKRSMIVDAGKMHVLDELLTKLKREGHRVLIYSTMTKVIDLLEEFMWYRKHQYMRLDGSSKISDRRDMVSDFQSKNDIFVFLLSTRAGGLGINLTAADTVIFYDSDWNPTVDAQAMDRAHRLGQTKQVTVYRLICKGTIEERILERAKEKSEIQRMVISGHNNFKPDVLKPKEMVSLLIDDDALKQKLEQAQATRPERAEKRKTDDHSAAPKSKRGRKKKIVQENNTTTAASTPRSTPQPNQLNGSGLRDGNSPFMDAADGGSSRASSPAMSSTPSTPSLQATTPSGPSRKGRGRPKGSTSSNKTSRIKNSAALKKALTAAEIAGTKAGMNAAYAAYGITKPPGTAGNPKPGALKS